MILVKMGGSVITNKDKPLSARRASIQKITTALKKIKDPLVIVHGGGSFGHYWSVKFDMHTKPARYDPRGVATVKNSMVYLNKIILDSFLKCNLNPYCLPPTDFMSKNKPIRSKILEIEKMAKSHLVPVTFGDALWFGNKKSFILSGDKIMSILASYLKPRLSIFLLNVDGLYSDLNSKDLIYNVGNQSPKISSTNLDVTGGMLRKLEEANKISRMGHTVFFVNGNKPERMISAVKRKKFEGTLFRGK
ncbi:MAG: gamma-glutamyl kinase [Nitrosopumilaceae archaeon]|nr:gamma-glutamyl kinase [Nitrosopumilaceae archaeon]NIU00497.1 gamma-glutamyl kinase [Nitrosopumilaceae archaeon]NIU86880.1 gamma-glutamyl kinase [Nitrosopumilaceae archaeon]NIV65560.1 gamma-glutamyl kinase [Nitrosopumilaceae archaeon]NIX61099.1 gamma-glutamyl kinase [Nitrosopumilaceae archaeon]